MTPGQEKQAGTDVRRLTLALLSERARDATVCPSEVARALADMTGNPAGWRAAMPTVHEAIDQMASDGEVRLSWRGRDLPMRNGPYRVHRAD